MTGLGRGRSGRTEEELKRLVFLSKRKLDCKNIVLTRDFVSISYVSVTDTSIVYLFTTINRRSGF